MGDVMVLKKAKVAVIAAAAALALGCGFTAGTAQAYADEAQADLALTTQMDVPALLGATEAVVAVNGTNEIVVTDNIADQTGTWAVTADNANVQVKIDPTKVTAPAGKAKTTITLNGKKKGTANLTVTFTTDSGKTATKTIAVSIKGNGDRDAVNGITYEVVNDDEATVKVKAVPSKKTIAVPASVKMFNKTYTVAYVAKNSFKKAASKLTTVTLPKTIITIGTSAFNGCKKLTSVKGAKNTVTIGQSAFKGCAKLKTCEPLTASTKLEKVNSYAFSGAKALTNPVIKSKKLSYMRVKVFQNCTKAKTITFKSTKLTKKGVKSMLKGSKATKVVVAKSAYKKFFTKSNCGKKVTVKVA